MAIFVILSVILTVFLVIFGVRLQRSLRRFRLKKTYTAAIEAPSISVCIPARNETHALTQCLERVLASDYEKLEIVVYDDRSKDDTSILAKSFAHAGVRFVPGDALPQGWLGRNHALQTLAKEASGNYLLFLSVDTFIHPMTISWLASYIVTERLSMMSIIPGRNGTWKAAVLFSPLRYFWELILSRPTAPATASALWMIERKEFLKNLDGFEPYKDKVQPETAIAARLGTDRYHCLINNEKIGVTYEKRWRSQCETSRRLLYPMAGGTTMKGIWAILLLLLLNFPLIGILSGLFMGWTMIQAMSLWILLAFMALYGVYTQTLWHKWWWAGGLLWPVVIFQELILMIQSMLAYKRGTVTWKGRSITASPFRVDSIRLDE